MLSDFVSFELEIAWGLHGELFYVAVRRWIDNMPVRDNLHVLIENAITCFLEGAPAAIRDLERPTGNTGYTVRQFGERYYRHSRKQWRDFARCEEASNASTRKFIWVAGTRDGRSFCGARTER
jgi:hypothetical protein